MIHVKAAPGADKTLKSLVEYELGECWFVAVVALLQSTHNGKE